VSYLQEDKEFQKFAVEFSDRIIEYCKSVVQDSIPYLEGSRFSDFEAEGSALADLETERSKFLEAVKKALQKKQFQDIIYLAENLTIFYERRSYLDEWVEVSTYALEAAISLNNLPSEAYILGNLGRVFRIKNMWDEAIDNCKQSISIYELLNENLRYDDSLKKAKAEILDTLGNILRSIGSLESLEDAEVQFTESIKLFQESSDLGGELKAWDGLAQVYTKQKKFDLAKKTLEDTLKRKKEYGDTDFSISVTLNNLGKILRDLDLFDGAELIFHEALKKKIQLMDWRGEATTYNEIGILKKKIGNFDDALKMFEKSLDIKREKGDSHGQGLSLLEIGSLYDELGEKIQACESWIQALANLTKQSEQYRQTEKRLIQEVLDSIDFKDLSISSLDILKNIEMNPLENQELNELLSLEDNSDFDNNRQEKLEMLMKVRDLCLLRKSQALNEITQRNIRD
jgi:tetratricopeptide (TPR) repeat protein